MAFSKKTYTSGQTAITADNLNAIQDELIDLKNGGLDNYLDTYLKNRCKYYSVSNTLSAETTGLKVGDPIIITEPGIYLVIIYHDLNYSHSSIQMADFSIDQAANILISGQVRTTGDSGGGCFSLGVVSCPANASIAGRCYIYNAQSNGKAIIKTFAIKIN